MYIMLGIFVTPNSKFRADISGVKNEDIFNVEQRSLKYVQTMFDKVYFARSAHVHSAHAFNMINKVFLDYFFKWPWF